MQPALLLSKTRTEKEGVDQLGAAARGVKRKRMFGGRAWLQVEMGSGDGNEGILVVVAVLIAFPSWCAAAFLDRVGARVTL